MDAEINYFLQQLINGCSVGGLYGLIAIGYTMVYGILGIINFAHGEVYMIGAFIAVISYLVFQSLGMASVAMILLMMLITSIIFTSLYGWIVERVAYRKLRGSQRLAPLISAIGMSIFLQNYVQITQGADVKAIQPIIKGGITFAKGSEFPIIMSYMQMLILCITVVLMGGLSYIISSTRLGREQRACAEDLVMAGLLGVSINTVISTTFVIGALLAAVAGFMFTLYYGVIDFFIGFLAGVKAFTAAVLGGIGSIPGAMLGGLIIGLLETFWAGYISSEYKDIAAFSVLIIVLIFLPTGLLGRPEIEKV